MSTSQAKKLALLAQGQGIEAVNIIQRGGVSTAEDRYRENIALAVANLSHAFHEFLKDQP